MTPGHAPPDAAIAGAPPRRRLPVLLALLVLFALSLSVGPSAVGPAVAEAPPAAPAETTITLLHFSDIEGVGPSDGSGGLAALAQLLAAARDRHPGAVTTLGGDLISPSLLSGLDEGAHMIGMAGALGVDLAVPGNHEFDFGAAVAAQRFGESAFTWVGSNVTDGNGAPFPGTVATTLREVAGVRVGFLGLTTPETGTLARPDPAVRFADPVPAARAAARALRQDGAQLVVALTHLGIPDDMALAEAVPEIDVILGGHTHQAFVHEGAGRGQGGSQVVLHAGARGRYLAILQIALADDGSGGLRLGPQWRFERSDAAAPEPAIAARAAALDARLAAALEQPLGRTDVELDSRRPTVRGGESAFGNFLADSMRTAMAADAAILNGGGIRGDRLYPAGASLTRRDLLTELPFGNRLVKLRLPGAALRAALENGLSQVAELAGRYPQLSGISLRYDPTAPPGSRLQAVKVGGRPLREDAVYTLAVSDYLAGGGDGYATLAQGELLVDPAAGPLLANVVAAAVEEQGSIAPRIEGRALRSP